jgi:thiazole synthase ThiGH ThiG subunit
VRNSSGLTADYEKSHFASYTVFPPTTERPLQPDPFDLIEAATEVVELGLHVFPYCTEDWVVCKRLLDAGCRVLMP